jgi:hypothetical protein
MVENLKKEFKKHFELFEDLDVYFWIASGGIRDFFAGNKPKDIDFFFPDQDSRRKAAKKILQIGAEKTKSPPRGEKFLLNEKSYDLVCWDGSGDPPCTAKNPMEMIEWFDYTVEMAALDNRGKFFCHPRFYDDVANKKLIRNPDHRIQDLYPRMNNKRLTMYIKKGYSIDMNNLLIFLEDQEATFEHRHSKNKQSSRIKKEKSCNNK